ncbi:MAG TPA: SH3-like domain-containing protein [Stellaceae bacterium]|jgi:nitrile hydratase|nr:SH3-like domain-containing protein [Stellaceae bacterium]
MFAPGDRVRVANLHPPGHRRTPFYVRGKSGVIERVCDPSLNPEELGYGFSGEPRRVLYRVRFAQRELWPDYAGPAGDTVDVDIYEHWLQKTAD